MGPFANFYQLSVRPLNLLSTSISIPCGRGIFRQLSMHSRDLLPNKGPSINFPHVMGRFGNSQCIRGTRRQIFVRQQDVQSSSVHILCVRRTFHQLSVCHWTFRQLPSTLSASAGPCVKCLCISGRSVIFSTHFVRPRDLPSTFRAAADIPSIFFVSAQPSVNFHQLSVRLQDLL